MTSPLLTPSLDESVAIGVGLTFFVPSTLIVASRTLEVAPHDRELGAVIGGCLTEIEAFFRRSIKAAQKQGSVRTDLVPKDVARLLLGVVLGIRVLARVRPERALLEGVARPALGLLD
jgi:TetR/AcrR family transcriptional regulator, transcriptional repressor for nem operon